MLLLLLFCRCLWHELFTMDDEDFLRSDCVIGSAQMAAMVTLLNKLLLRLYRLEIAADSAGPPGSSSGSAAATSTSAVLRKELRDHATKVFNAVFKIDDRRHFFGDSTIWHWSATLEQDLVLGDEGASVGGGPPSHGMAAAAASGAAAMDEEEEEDGNDESMEVDSQGTESPGRQVAKRSPLRNVVTWRALLAHPQVLPFSRRVAIFQDLLDEDKAIQMSGARTMDGWLGMGGVSVDIDRSDIVKCAYSEINRLNSDDLKGRLKVQFISKQGYTEAGIDGGGLFKEFMDDLVSNLFREELGLFKGTEEQLLVPNPAALDTQRMELFRFAGKMLGKALYESLLVDPQFSGVFLNVLLGRSNHFDDLVFLDQQLYASMKQLKHMNAESVAALGLTFESQRSGDGVITTHELVPGGSNIPVTAHNLTEYLHRFAHFKLNLEFQRASKQFNSGLHELIPEDWIRLFSPRELQQLISGQKKGIDIDDMKRNINYAGGYAEAQPYVQAFWRIVSEMTLDQQGELLKFITSCSRQPLRGFSQLAHRMCIQRVPQYSEEAFESASTVLTARLPSAATCVNLLKLPEYDNPETLKDKLLYAISHNTGFELS
jgi:ubiquitin-protein ligase E3 C